MNQGSHRVGKASGSLHNSEPEFLLAGKLLKPHGLKGELWMKVITDFPELFFSQSFVFVGRDYQKMEISRVREAGEKVLIGFKGLNHVDEVRKLVNCDVFFSTGQMPPLPKGEYYIHQLIGLMVFSQTGEEIGKIMDVLQSGANDVYVIRTNEPSPREILIPAIESVIREIDLESAKMVINADEWLE